MLLSCYTTLHDSEVSSIDANLCTHLIVMGGCFLQPNSSIVMPPREFIEPYVKLKSVNPALKILITLTPIDNEAMSKLVLSHGLMDNMLTTVVEYMERNNIDGIDYDWEFPVWSPKAKKTDKSGFSALLKMSRDKFHSKAKKYLLSVAVAAPYVIVDQAYDIRAINEYVDLVQLMNYDFHFYSKSTQFTGFNSPLHAQPDEPLYLAKMCSEYSTRHWLEGGLDLSKLMFGIPTYSRGFALLHAESHGLYAKATGPSSYGDWVSYSLMCQLVNKTGVTYVWNEYAASPYIFFDREWISFEDVRTVVAKAQYAKGLGVAGVMVYDLNSDDANATCGQGKYPLINACQLAACGRSNCGFVSANSRPAAARTVALSVPTRGLRPLERWLCQCQLAAFGRSNCGFVSANSRPSAARTVALSVPTRGLRPLEL
ncbi:glycosyl hydrolases family 18 domain-containing protein [Ditylenchus destructor]|nr:glycosyl hydrolases family 18 domain-containing protein [Ditylenchus destructor]